METIQNRIIEEAAEMFLRNGYRKVRTDDIASNIGISKRTLYEYFSSKQELLHSVILYLQNRKISRLKLLIHRLQDSDKYNYIQELKQFWLEDTRLLKSMSRDFVEDVKKIVPKKWKSFMEETEHETYIEQLVKIGEKHGFFRKMVDYKLFRLLHRHAMFGIFNSNDFSDLNYTMEHLIEETFYIFFFGVLSEEGQNIFIKEFKIDTNN